MLNFLNILLCYRKKHNHHFSKGGAVMYDKVQGQPNTGEREFEVGKDESWAGTIKSQNDAWFANVKRTYDEYQQESLESVRRNRSIVHKDSYNPFAQEY